MMKVAVTKLEGAIAIGCGRTKMDGLINDGTIKAVRSGKVVLIPVKELERYIASLPAAVEDKSHSNFPQHKGRRETKRGAA